MLDLHKTMVASNDSSIQDDIQCIASHYKKMLEAKESWDIKKHGDARQNFSDALYRVTANQKVINQIEDDWLSNVEKQLKSIDYIQRIESFFNRRQIPFSGEFPDYQIPPFKLSFDFSKNIVKLSMGRRLFKNTVLEPEHLVDWVAKYYFQVCSSSFNQSQFCKEIMLAYKYLSQSNWRLQISVKDIYKILTIKSSTKKEYSESVFMFDLARLLQIPTIELDGFYFEFSANKESRKNYFLTDKQGKEKTVGLVSISPKESDNQLDLNLE